MGTGVILNCQFIVVLDSLGNGSTGNFRQTLTELGNGVNS